MDPLDSLGHGAILTNVLALLQTIQRPVVVIDGPAASGKSTLLNAVEAHTANRLSAKFLRGDALESDIAEHVLAGRVERISRREIADFALDAAEDVKSVLGDGTVPFGRLIQRTLAYATTGVPGENLSDAQQRFLARLLNVLARKAPLLICDDLQYWDHASLLFLRRLLRGDFDQSYKRLKALSVVIALDQHRVPSADVELIADIIARHTENGFFILQRPSLEEFGAVLAEFGLAAPVTKELQQELFSITGGNLALAKSVIAYLNDGGELLPKSDATALRKVFEQRLAALEPGDMPLKDLLSTVAVAGRVLDLNVLACIFGFSKDAANEVAARAASQLNFVSVSEDAIGIEHESLRAIIATIFSAEQKDRHRSMAECIRKIRPGDYGLRAAHLEAAGDADAAAALRVMERIVGLRSGQYGWRMPVDSNHPVPPSIQRIRDWSRKVDLCFEASSSGNVDHALTILDDLETDVPSPLPLEAAYLRAQLLSDMNNDAEVQRAIGILEELDLTADAEEELRGRASEIRIICLSNLRRLDEGRKVESELRRFYQKRATFDPGATFALNRLRRRSEAINIPEVANDRLKLALDFFGPSKEGDVPLNWAEYLVTLNNLCANEMVLGRFELAARYAGRLSAAASEISESVLRRSEYLWSNVLLTQLLTGTPASDVRQAFEAIRAKENRSLVDSMLLEINLASIRALSGEIELAFDDLSKAFSEFSLTEAASPYVKHFSAATLAVLSWLRFDRHYKDYRELAFLSLREMEGAEYSHSFLKRRFEIVDAACRTSAKRRTLQSIVSSIESRGMMVGPSWRFFGRALLLTDIQYWSDP